jgi:sugar phosphate isomerase/epimerase
MTKEISRRSFLKTSSMGVCSGGFALRADADESPAPAGYRGPICFFSKPLQRMEWKRLAKSIKPLGFDGIDLTVRPGGDVLPERVTEDLPKAVGIFREQGLEVPMITTALTSPLDPTVIPIFRTAHDLHIPYCKLGYYRYRFIDVRKELRQATSEFRKLTELGEKYQIQLGYHNDDAFVGSPIWDTWLMMQPLSPKWVGYYFDICHATSQGAAGVWKVSLNLAFARMKILGIQDLYLVKRKTGGGKEINCPLGKGWVDWKYFLGEALRSGFQGPMTLHVEYEISGSTQAEKEANTISAARQDLGFLKAQLKEAEQGRSRAAEKYEHAHRRNLA